MKYMYCLIQIALISTILCREINLVQQDQGRQLFVSRRVVTEGGEFDGGVLVNETGCIEGVLTRASVDTLLSQTGTRFQIIDGGDLALMAGVVDTHVHVNEPGRTSWEGYVTATQAAAAGGVTTIIDMPLLTQLNNTFLNCAACSAEEEQQEQQEGTPAGAPRDKKQNKVAFVVYRPRNSIPPTTTLNNLKIKSDMAKEEIYVDVGFWGGVVPGNEIELHDMIRAGVVGFKCFLVDSGVSEFPNITPDELNDVFSVLNGSDTVLAFHAEVQLKGAPNCSDSKCDPEWYGTYLASRPDQMEIDAVKLIASFIPNTDVHVHVVHVSSAAVVPILEEARAARVLAGHRGWRAGVTAETCNHYLTLSAEDVPPRRTEFKCAPPIRNNTNRQKLWEYIRHGRLDLVASDHSPSVAELKGSDFMKAWGGIASVQFDLSLFWTEASARGLGLTAATHYLSAGPARLVGLQERKGTLKPGLDADLIFFDPDAAFIVTPDVIRYKNKISPYMNRVLRGKVIQTYVRGQLVYADDQLVGEPKGKLLLNGL